ncbi:MAG TPA: ABC transporter permease [Nitrospirota bacterium]|nr:ABC transporter permease [Nitrospirota bacterium]
MKNFVWRRALAVARKEVYHILRDPTTLGAALVLPVFMVIMFGVAIEFNVKNVALAVNDSDQTQSSRRLLDTFGSSDYFLIHRVTSPHDAVTDVSAERARAALIIPPRFEKDLFSGRGAEAQILVDGSDNSTVGPVLSYVGSIQNMASQRIGDFDPTPPYEIRTRFLFNPELNSRWFVIPGLTVVVMSILSILLTALTVAREWENGSMELLLSTPVQPLEIIVGKLAPYGILGIIAVVFVYIIARTVFGVPFVGNLLVFSFGCLLFIVTYLAQGLLISVVTRKQTIAMQLSMMSGMLPANLLSGFIFPIESMPKFFQYFTMILPARWFMQVARDTFLKGSGLIELGVPFLALIFFCALMIFLAAQRFKRDLEP